MVFIHLNWWQEPKDGKICQNLHNKVGPHNQTPVFTRTSKPHWHARKKKSAQRPKFYGTVVANFGTALAITAL